MNRYKLIVMTNAKPGRDKEFNDWYDDIHLDDVLKIPGIVAAQRFKGTTLQRSGPPPAYNYVAIYEVETDNLAETIAELDRRRGTPEMPLSDAMDDKRMGLFIEEMGKVKRR